MVDLHRDPEETAGTAMLDFLEAAFKLNNAQWSILLMMCGAGYVIIAQVMDSHGPAMIGFPILVTGAACGQYALTMLGIQLAEDKIVNGSIGMGSGMFAATFLLIVILWAATSITSR
jgi:hypothetical protein